jgi:hypothetical protein
MRRYAELDALRGLMLVWITLTHLPTGVSRFANQPLGYLSATEGFIFLSGLFTGLIYVRLAEREGYRPMFRKLWARTRRLYLYQVLLLAFAFLVEAQIAAQGNRPAVHNLLDFYFAVGPFRAVTDALLLIYRPPLLDILPMYIILLALSPVLLWAAGRVGWRAMLAGSGLVWLLAQFGLRQFTHDAAARFLGLQIPLNQMGAFDVWAWQLWWMVGLWLGARWARNEGLPFADGIRRMTVAAALVAGVLLALRYAELSGAIDFGQLAFLVDKWHLGAVRMANFAALATLAIRFQPALRHLAIRPFVMFGQASLQVFCVHLVTVFVALTLMGMTPVVSGWRVPLLIAASLSAQWAAARGMAWRRSRNSRSGRAQPKEHGSMAERSDFPQLQPATPQKAAKIGALTAASLSSAEHSGQ